MCMSINGFSIIISEHSSGGRSMLRPYSEHNPILCTTSARMEDHAGNRDVKHQKALGDDGERP